MVLEVRRHFSPWIALSLIALAEILTLSVWFSATVVSGPLQRLWQLNVTEVAFLTASVQLGFVAGAVISSITGVADRFNARRVFALAAVGGALVNGLFIFSNSWEMGMLLRMLTGAAMVGVYPVAVKLVTEWAPARRGTAIGMLVGALTLGSALPHLILFVGVSAPWQVVLLASSGLALLGAGIVAFLLPDPPNEARSTRNPPKISLVSLRSVLANKSAMLANYGYFGHMWELYAMWTWFPAFVYASFIIHGEHRGVVASSTMIGFLVIGIAGAIGSLVGGLVADRIGRTAVASAAMILSGLCALTIGLTYGGPPWVVIAVGLVWGVTVVADSAQFSAAVTELSAPQYIGTALTLQTAVGFLITIISINLIGAAKDLIGWQWAFTLLSVGPFLGVYAMLRLRARASSIAMANGKR
jgi:MFS family permease